MKQSKRFLAVLLAMIMTLSGFTVAASAFRTDYSTPAGYDSVLEPYFTNDQAATALMDFLDDDVFAKMDVQYSIPVINIDIVIRSWDTLCDSLDEILSHWLVKAGEAVLNLGAIEDMDWSDVRNSSCRRRSTTTSDFQLLLKIFTWVGKSDNANALDDAVDGTLSLGVIDKFFSLTKEAPMLKNLHGYVNDMVYKALLNNNEDTGYVEGEADSYNLDDIIQTFLNDHVIKFVFDLLDADTVKTVADFLGLELADDGTLKNDMGLLDLLPSLTADDISITTTSTYDFFINIFMALIDDIVIPFAGTLILDLLEIAPDDPTADTSYIDIAINLFVDAETLGYTEEDGIDVVSTFLDQQGVENPTQPKPIDKVNVTLEYILKVGLKKYIHFVGTPGVDSHLQLTEYFSGMLSDLIRMVIPMLPSLSSDFSPLTSEQKAAVEQMGNEELFAFAAKMVLEAFVDGVYFPDDCDTIKELATYTLINVNEELIHSPDSDFMTDISNGTLNPDSLQCLDVAASVLNYYLVGQTTYESSNVKPTFNELLSGCFDTFLGKYAALFPTETSTNPWVKLYSSVCQWIPLTNIFYGVEDSSTGLQDLFMNSIIGNVLDFDINGLLGIIGRRPDSDLNKPLSQLVANLLGRVLNGVFKLPTEGNNQSTNSFQVNSLVIPYDYTRLDQIITVNISSSTPGYTDSLNGCGLKNTARMLLMSLKNLCNEGALAAESLDLVAELLGLIDLDNFEYLKRQYDTTAAGESYSINQLRDLYNQLKISDNEGLNYYDADYTFCRTVDFNAWNYKDFKSALGDANELINKYDSGDAVLRSEITYAYYRLYHIYNDWLLRDMPAANDFYLDRVMTNNPRIASNDDGQGGLMYTKRSWDAYTKAYNFATKVENEYTQAELAGTLGDYPQSKVNEARKQLRDAVYGLKINAGVGDADYSKLQRAIDNLKNLDSPSLFTDKSVSNVVETYNEALKFIREVWYDSDSQVVVDGVTERLNKAYNLLVSIPVIKNSEDYEETYFKTDEVNSFIYGLEDPFYTDEDRESCEDDFNQYVEWYMCGYTTNGMDSNFVPTENNGHGTGAKIQLRSDDDGDGVFKVEREYTLIYFGDVNGDGMADGTDSVIIKAYAARLLTSNAHNTHIVYAGDVDCEDGLTTIDANQVARAGVGRTTIDQSPSAHADNTIKFTDLVAS